MKSPYAMRYFPIFLFLLIGYLSCSAQLVVSNTQTSQQLVQTLFGSGITISNTTITCDTTQSMGSFNAVTTNLGLGQGVLLTTGTIQNAVGPNFATGVSANLGLPGYQPLTNLSGQSTFDACRIEFDVVPQCDSIGIKYVFGSDEYMEFVNSINDIFAFFISGPGIVGNKNIAIVPGTANMAVSINNVNCTGNKNMFYVCNEPGSVCPTAANCPTNAATTTLQYDGFTVPLIAKAAVQPCSTYHITLAIADGSDGLLDSGVFLEANGIGCLSPQLNLSAAVPGNTTGIIAAVEGCMDGLLSFTLPSPPVKSVTYQFTIGGTATAGVDYGSIPSSITFPAGVDSVTLSVPILYDNLIEGTETLQLIYADTALCSGQIFTDTATLQIFDAPQTSAGTNVTACSGKPVAIGVPTAVGNTYQWLSPVGISNPLASNPSITRINASTTAIDTIKLYLQTTVYFGLCTYLDSTYLYLQPKPAAAFVANPVCFGDSTAFISTSVGDSIAQYRWTFGDGKQGIKADSIQHLYNTANTFNAKLVVTTDFGCADSLTQPVVVHALPVPDFTVPSVCAGAASIFSGNSPAITNRKWDFGDKSPFTVAANPTHTYAQPGTYQVRFTLTDANGCIDSITKPATVFTLPKTTFTATSVCLGQANVFTSTTQAGSGAIASHNWTFPDGATAATPTASHTFGTFGRKNIIFSVTDMNTCQASYTDTTWVYPKPVADFTPDSVCLKENTLLQNTSTISPPGNIINYRWTFETGRNSSTQNGTYRYSKSGIFTPTLRVATQHGCADTVSYPVVIFPKPNVTFNSIAACPHDSVFFADKSTLDTTIFRKDTLQRWTWTPLLATPIQADTLRNQRNAFAIFDTSGIFKMKLVVKTNRGCADTLTRSFEVYPASPAALTLSDTVCFGNSALLSADVAPPAIRADWFRDSTKTAFQQGSSYVTPTVVYPQTYFVRTNTVHNCLSRFVPLTASLFPRTEGSISPADSSFDIPNDTVQFSWKGNAALINYNWDFGDSRSSSEATPTHQYAQEGIYTVFLAATDDYGCNSDYSTQVEIRFPVMAVLPSAFSPNGDTQNDVFFMGNHLMQSGSIQIFNRWGHLVFESSKLDFQWDGTANGEPLPEGIYPYSFSGIDLQGKAITHRGTITLIR